MTPLEVATGGADAALTQAVVELAHGYRLALTEIPYLQLGAAGDPQVEREAHERLGRGLRIAKKAHQDLLDFIGETWKNPCTTISIERRAAPTKERE